MHNKTIFFRQNDINWQLFPSRIEDMNRAFERPVNTEPTVHPQGTERIRQFIGMLAGSEFLNNAPDAKCELKEALKVIELLDAGKEQEGLSAFADLIGDIIVYCMSEATQWGLPMGNVLNAIMDSQDSKLVDGKPIPGDAPGKFGKGPNYKAPDEKIREIIMVSRSF